MKRAERKLKMEEVANYIHTLDSYTYNSVAHHFNVTLTLVKQTVIEYGLPKPQRVFAKPQSKRDVCIVQDYDSGETMQSIGDKYGISKQRVYQILLKQGKINHNKDKFKPHTRGGIIFDGLRNYLNDNKINMAEFSYLISKELNESLTPSKLINILQYYNHMNFKLIVVILKITGLNFENCFNIGD